MARYIGDKPLKTERLVLEPLLPEHARLLYPDLTDERLYSFIPTNAPESAEALEERYRRLASRSSPDGSEVWLNFALRLAEAPGAVYVGTLEATVLADGSAHIAYTVFVPFQRRGYAREGCARLLAHLTEDYGVRVVVAEMDTRNTASFSLVESLGFGRAETTPGVDHFKGSVSDEHRYEWRPG